MDGRDTFLSSRALKERENTRKRLGKNETYTHKAFAVNVFPEVNLLHAAAQIRDYVTSRHGCLKHT